MSNNDIPAYRKYGLTVLEASGYFGIGETKIRSLIREYPTEDFMILNGSKVLIKRKKFEEFLDRLTAI